jgi:glycogen debranching enzyme
MDAKIGEWVVTPRHGKAVEVNALWYNAMRTMAELSGEFADKKREQTYQNLADRIQESFNQKFWNSRSNCLFDCIRDDFSDSSIRPNQLFAISLPFPLLSSERAQAVIEVVQGKLLTPYGLRTLAPEEPDYRKTYGGSPYARDSAYHQGTVWAWLIGPFVDAYFRVFGESKASCDYLQSLFDPFRRHLCEALLGSVSEIFDADPPHSPKGCGAQAWSVAEILRACQKISHVRSRICSDAVWS